MESVKSELFGSIEFDSNWHRALPSAVI